ncbi:PREDICTED: testis-expressed protein 19.2-like [Propithecus coquereli]|uniref:testis-expressed protein 19.2-like n=1 Tax=Propithecus coquereli TaxID=379532 RepID=UPI00063EF47C|nr:PREDICTED: testis-expressed protein 19.2-like [Propithecus coquereli]
MCPPVSLRHGREGMSYLYASWLYHLRHGDPPRLCFACFRVAFLDLKDSLESEDWEDEDWDPELMEHTGAGSEQQGAPGMGPSWEQGPGQPVQGGSQALGQGAPASGPEGPEEAGLDHDFVPTDLQPHNAVPLGLGPEDADWTQGLPWRLEELPACSHWPSCSPSWQGFLRVDLPPGEPMVLELGTTWAVNPAETEAWLLDLQVVSIVGCYDAIYLRKMTPGWALRTPEEHWKVLLEPEEVWVVRLQDAPQEQDLQQWKLSIVEISGHSAELVPADTALLTRGFTIVSYSPWNKRETEEGDSASEPQSSTQGQEPSTTETQGRGPGESLAVVGASAPGELSCFQPLNPGPQN